MRCFLAIYDPAYTGAGGNYWIWKSKRLAPQVLDRFYYTFAKNHLPPDPNQLTTDELYGGCAGLDETWLCWYRFVNGGRDQLNRPGRFIILAAFVERKDAKGRDWSGVLDGCPVFRQSAALAPSTCPLQVSEPPDATELEWHAPPTSCDPERLAKSLDGLPVKLNGRDAVRHAAALCAALSDDLRFDCAINRRGGMETASLTVLPKTMAKSKPVTPLQKPGLAKSIPTTHTRGLTHKLAAALVLVFIALLVGLVVGYRAHAYLHGPESIAFQIINASHAPSTHQAFSAKTSVSLALVPETLQVEQWEVDGQAQDGPNGWLETMVLDDRKPHHVKATFRYKSRAGRESYGNAMATIRVYTQDFGETRIDVEPIK